MAMLNCREITQGTRLLETRPLGKTVELAGCTPRNPNASQYLYELK